MCSVFVKLYELELILKAKVKKFLKLNTLLLVNLLAGKFMLGHSWFSVDD